VTRCRILVVEDEAITAMLVEEMVLDFGSEVVGPAAKMRLLSDRASPRSRSRLNQQATCARVIGVIKRVMSRSSAAPH